MTYTFSATYKDGKRLTLSPELSYDDLPRDGIDTFEVTTDGGSFFTLKLDEGQKLIYRKRVEKTMGQPDYVVYLFGWRKDGYQSINYLSQDGVIIQAGKFVDTDPWMYTPTLRGFEV